MWDCDSCGCQAIAGSLAACPMCMKEAEMPRTNHGGSSNAWDDQDGAPEQPQDAPEQAPAPAPRPRAPRPPAPPAAPAEG